MARNTPLEVSEHFYSDIDVTIERLNRFAEASRTTQLAVLAALRERSVDNAVDLALTAVIFSIVLPFVGVTALPLDKDVLAGMVATFIVILLLTLVVGASIAWSPLRHHRRRQLAAVWLGAFEDELTRRRSLKGRTARAWLARH